MYLIDTDIIVWVLRGRKDIVDKISELNSRSQISISVITIAELYQNIFPSELVDTEEYLNQHAILEVDQKIAKIGGLYWQEYNKRLKNLSLADCLIAATANVNDLTLVSFNVRHFPMKDIKILNPKSKSQKKNN